MAEAAFTGKMGWASNMSHWFMVWDDILFWCLETPYQREKTLIPEERALFTPDMPGWKARELGRDKTKITLRPGWDDIKFDIMRKLIREKFRQNLQLQKELLATGDTHLEETNYWHDNDFGNCTCGRPKCQAPGKNMLGIILMEEREYWREKK